MTSNNVTIQISNPIKINNEDVFELKFSEPSIGDVIDAEEKFESEMARMTFVLASMCGAENTEFRKIGTADFNAILKKCEPLMGNA